MDKKAVSGVITAVLLILLVIAAVAIIWVVVINIIKSSSESIGNLDFASGELEGMPKNVILLIGDGMGEEHVKLAGYDA